MPQAFDGFSFDLFAYIRRHRQLFGTQKTPPSQEEGSTTEQDERLRREQDEVAFWGLVAFPVL